MRILLLNPNTSEKFTAAIQAAAERHKSYGTEVVTMNPDRGPRTLEGMYDQLLAGLPSLEVLLSREPEFDGFVIACYGGDPLVQATRQTTSKPVVGIMEAGFYIACMVGRQFSIVATGHPGRGSWDSIRRFGMEHRCASIRGTGLTVLDLEAASDERVREIILDEARKAVEEDGADVICLGCAGMVGLDKELQVKIGVPVIDGVAAALKLVEALVGYGIGTSKRGAYASIGAKELLNMPALFSSPYR